MKYNDAKREAGLPFKVKLIRVILLDVRPTVMNRRKELVGLLSIPVTLMMNIKQSVAWRFDELKEPMRGVACDVTDRGMNMVFPIMQDSEVLASDGSGPLGFDQIVDLWKKHEPALKDD